MERESTRVEQHVAIAEISDALTDRFERAALRIAKRRSPERPHHYFPVGVRLEALEGTNIELPGDRRRGNEGRELELNRRSAVGDRGRLRFHFTVEPFFYQAFFLRMDAVDRND